MWTPDVRLNPFAALAGCVSVAGSLKLLFLRSTCNLRPFNYLSPRKVAQELDRIRCSSETYVQEAQFAQKAQANLDTGHFNPGHATLYLCSSTSQMAFG